MSSRKRFGQHFLNDHSIVRKIIESARLTGAETVLEIGPGKGVLTPHLAALSKKMIALELDRNLIPRLSEACAGLQNIEIVQGDALSYDYGAISAPFTVVANLPYNVSTPILLRLNDFRKNITTMVLMFQKEVANRICANPGQKSYGSLSVFLQYFHDASPLFDVKRESFSPAPSVESQVIRLIPRKVPPVSVHDEDIFFRIIKSSFTHKRKTLKNNLATLPISGSVISRVLDECRIDPGRRGETLSMEEFARIANFMGKHFPLRV